MLDIVLNHWAAQLYLGCLLGVILGNVLTWTYAGAGKYRDNVADRRLTLRAGRITGRAAGRLSAAA